MGSWTDLLHSSSKLLEQAAPSAQFPPLQWNLDQLEALSEKLKAKTLRTEDPTQSIASTRLLAREGINAEQLAGDLKSFELKAWSDTQRDRKRERMATEAEMGGWTDLLHSSLKILEQAAPSAQFPPLQRNLDQLEAASKKLKAKTLRIEVPTQSIAATRLLACEGINAEQLARDLKSFELKAWNDTQSDRERDKMANDAEMGSWMDLLHSSSKLLEQAAPSARFPPLQRHLDQLEALSKELKAKTLRTEAPTQSIAAKRLPAGEGIKAEQLAWDLKSFELKAHEMALVSAIQEAQKDNLRSVNDYTMTVLEAVGARLDQVTADFAELRTSVVADLKALRVEMQDNARSIHGMMNDLFRVIDGCLPRRRDQPDHTPA